MKLPRVLLLWIPWAFVITVVFGTMYAIGQTILRTSANVPQVQIAEDAVRRLNLGASPTSVLPNATVELRDSLDPYVIVYDENGKQIASSVRLDGGIVDVPQGVLDHARNSTDHRVTWQPVTGVRSDIVVKHFSNAAQSGFVVAGQSLREIEKQENVVLWLSVLGWLISLLGSLSYVTLLEKYPHFLDKKKT